MKKKPYVGEIIIPDPELARYGIRRVEEIYTSASNSNEARRNLLIRYPYDDIINIRPAPEKEKLGIQGELL